MWPPRGAQSVDLFLTPNDELSEKPAPEEGTYQLVYDAERVVTDRANRDCMCARFALGPVEQDLRFAGIPEFAATVVPQGPGGHVAAMLYSSKDGSLSDAEVVGWGMVDLRFAQGGETASSVVPGQELKVTVPLQPLDVVIPKGSTLILLVGESGYGGSLPPDRSSPSVFPVQLQVGGDKSKITLDTFETKPGDFFTPPKEPRK